MVQIHTAAAVREEVTHLVADAQKAMKYMEHGLEQRMQEVERIAGEIDWFIALPVILAFSLLWSVVMRYAQGDDFIVSSLHASVVVVIAVGNLLYEADEKLMFLIMTSYFVADLIHYCLTPKYAIFIFHHVLTVFAVYHMVTALHFSQHLLASKAALVEISTPFMNFYKTTQKAVFGALFVLSFIATRVIWLAYISAHGMSVSKQTYEIVLILLFCALNLYWLVEIIRKSAESFRAPAVAKEVAPAEKPSLQEEPESAAKKADE